MTPSTLLFGATSILGFQIARLFPHTMPFVTPAFGARSASHWPALRLSDTEWVKALFRQHPPDILLYCHAVCDVPKWGMSSWQADMAANYLGLYRA